MDRVLFEETQNNTLLVIVAIVSSVPFGLLSIVQIAFHKPFGNHPAPDWVLLLFFIGSIIAAFFFRAQKLRLLITENEIRISFGILTSKMVIKVVDIKSISVRKYDAIKEFWGWGIRYNNNEHCFTVSGDNAIEIELYANEKILIGIQQPEKIRSVIDQLFIQEQKDVIASVAWTTDNGELINTNKNKPPLIISKETGGESA